MESVRSLPAIYISVHWVEIKLSLTSSWFSRYQMLEAVYVPLQKWKDLYCIKLQRNLTFYFCISPAPRCYLFFFIYFSFPHLPPRHPGLSLTLTACALPHVLPVILPLVLHYYPLSAVLEKMVYVSGWSLARWHRSSFILLVSEQHVLFISYYCWSAGGWQELTNLPYFHYCHYSLCKICY